jgi:HlyD family secretion protein
MKKLVFGFCVLALIGGGAYLAWGMGWVSAAAPAPALAQPAVTTSSLVISEAKVVPARSAALSFELSGAVQDVLVAEEDHVQAGQVIARLDNAHQAARLAQTQAQLRQAQAKYQQLIDGPSAEEIVGAEAQVQQAQAQLRQTLGMVTPDDIAAVQLQIEQAQVQLQRLQAGDQNSDVRSTQAALQQATAALETQRTQLSGSKTTAELQVRMAAEGLIQAQTTYSTAKWYWEYVESTGHDPVTPTIADSSHPGETRANSLNNAQKQQYHDAFTRAEAALRSAEFAVQQARVAYDAAHQAEISGLQAAEQQVGVSQINLDRITTSIKSEQIPQARAQLAGARASLSKLRGPQRDNQIAVAQAALDVAQANLARLKAGPRPSEMMALQAQVESAQADVAAAQIDLDRTELKAPFAAVIASIDLKPGEFVASGTPVVEVGDNSTWQIETTDLTELSIGRVRADAPATITFDAIPNLALAGKVLRVKGFGENRQGDIVYRVILQPLQIDPRMRWNMTASVTIAP